MNLSSYADLQAAIADFINRTDLEDVIPAFIALAEAQMNRGLRCRRMIGRSDAELDSEFTEVPPDFIGPIDFVLKTYPLRRLCFVDSANLQEHLATGLFAECPYPFEYALVGDALQLLPEPSTPVTAELTYWKRPPRLSDSNSSNWVLANHPDIYLYGALVQASPYLGDDARTVIWSTLFTRALADANAGDPVPTHETTLRADREIFSR